MAVRIRMKMMGRPHRPFFRMCAITQHSPRDGKVLEELGYYDPMVREVDARAVLKGDRIAYWIGVGALPSEKCAVLIAKYGKDGTHVAQQQAALEKIKTNRPKAPAPWSPPPKPVAAPEPAPAAAEGEAPAESAPSE